MSKRSEVYAAIDGERAYQNVRWASGSSPERPGTRSDQPNSPTEWLVFIEHYVNKSKALASTLPYVEADPQIMDNMRKIAAMAVAAMEQHGAPRRG